MAHEEGERPDESPEAAQETPEDQPGGAIMVTTFLALVIVLSWFLMFIVYGARS